MAPFAEVYGRAALEQYARSFELCFRLKVLTTKA